MEIQILVNYPQNFLKDYEEPSFYMRYFQALFLENFYEFLQKYSDSTMYQWHRTIESRFPLAFFAQVIDMTHMRNLYNYENVCNMIDELKVEILTGKTFICFIQRTDDQIADYNRQFVRNEVISSADISNDSSYIKITSDE